MAVDRKPYAPPPRRRSSDVVKREFRRRVRGKPTSDRSMLSVTRFISRAFARFVSLSLISLLIAVFLLAGLGSGMLVGYFITAEPVVTEQIRSTNETTRVLDQNGDEIAILTGSLNINREYIPLGSVRDTYVPKAFMAIEDERFEEHVGIDPRRIGSAILSAVVNSGTPTHGGSTITQQTVKLISGSDQRSAQRKIQEWYIAIQLEQQKSKDEIMELYINLVPMGNSYVGIQAAAKAYFAKDAWELNLLEAAFLAGIPNRPATYNPLTETGRRNALRRMRIVLSKMYELDMIDEAEYEEALNTELVFRQTPQTVSATQINSYFVDYVLEQVINDLQDRRGYSPQMAAIAVYNYGFTIETTFDPDLQADIEQTFKDESLFMTDPQALVDYPERPNGSIVVIENMPNPGQIKGMVGGFGEKEGNFVFNRAVAASRQPGSSIKPLAVYGPAIDTGRITAASIFTDKSYEIPNPGSPDGPYEPRNAGGSFRGNMTVREAITRSINTINVYIWRDFLVPLPDEGNDPLINLSYQYLRQTGIDGPEKIQVKDYPASAIGGTYGVSALEMAGGYSTFANNGLYTKPYAYTRVLDLDGNVLLENRPIFHQVYRSETAFILTDIMQDVINTPIGTARSLTDIAALEQSFAGKTGTTDNNRDKWFVGYSPYYTAAVWYGFDGAYGHKEILPDDLNNAMRIWQDAMIRIHEGMTPQPFNPSDTVVTIEICSSTSLIANEYCPAPFSEYFIPGAVMNPSTECTLHVPEPTPTPEPTPEPTPDVEEVVETEAADDEENDRPGNNRNNENRSNPPDNDD